VKRSLLVEADGGPLSVVVAGANVRDDKLLEATLDAISWSSARDPRRKRPSTFAWTRATTTARPGRSWRSKATSPTSGASERRSSTSVGEKRYPARRWVVERTLGWLSKCRTLLVRYEKKAANYLGLIKVACILLWYRRQHRLSLSR
jgi:putative transposase